MNNIELLKMKISAAFSENASHDSWGKPQLMSKALADVQLAFDTPGDVLPSRSVTLTLFSFRNSGKLITFLDVKYVCFGVGQHIGTDEWCLLNDPSLLKKLFNLVDTYQSEPRRFRKCYQGLLSGYFGYPCHSNKTPEADRINWKTLRDFLYKRLPFALSASLEGSWLGTLDDHVNLLRDKPCERYKDALLDDDYTELKAACNSLGVPSESWVWEEAIVSRMEAACSLNDSAFSSHLKSLLKAITDNNLSHLLSIRCISLLLVRYVAIFHKEEHPELRDSAVRIIGNPWLNRAAWDAQVKNDDARKMVDGWLKKKLIFDFFSLLSEDGSADKRRLNYWLRYESVIDDMWFALGPHARNNTGADFKKFRERAKGRLLDLENSGTAENNAFILCLGEWVIVEFGSKGNACYIYRHNVVPFELGARSWVNCNTDLKSKKHGKQFIHRDGDLSWEEKLDDMLSPHFSWRPSEMPYSPVVASATNQNSNQTFIRQNTVAQIATEYLVGKVNPEYDKAHDKIGIENGKRDNIKANTFPHISLELNKGSAVVVDELTIDDIYPDMRVRNAEFGLGTVKKVEAKSYGQELTVLFDSFARPKLMLFNSARLERVQLSHLVESQFNKFIARNNLTVTDLRSKGGALWVITPNSDPGISKMLTDFGFTLKSSRGWWKE